MVGISIDLLENTSHIQRKYYDGHEKKLRMSCDLSHDTTSSASPSNDKLPSQTLTKSDHIDANNYQDDMEDPLPFSFEPEPRVQQLYSTDSYFLHDYPDPIHQRRSYSVSTPTSRYSPNDTYVNYIAQPQGESTLTNESRYQNIPYAHHHLNTSYAQNTFPAIQSAPPMYISPAGDRANVFRGHYGLSSHYPYDGTVHQDISYGRQDPFSGFGHDSLQEINERDINPNDVLCGRGGLTNTHSGNRIFRNIVKTYQEKYIMAKKKDKPLVAEFIVNEIKAKSPSGRFIKKNKATGKWADVGDKKAIEKTCQALREGMSKVREKMDPPMMKPQSNFTTVNSSGEYHSASMDPSVAEILRAQYLTANANRFECNVQFNTDEENKQRSDFSPVVPSAEKEVGYKSNPITESDPKNEEYSLRRPDSFDPLQLLNYDDTTIDQSPIRMVGSWDVHRSPLRRKRPKSDLDSPCVEVDSNFFAPSRSVETDRHDRSTKDRSRQSKSV